MYCTLLISSYSSLLTPSFTPKFISHTWINSPFIYNETPITVKKVISSLNFFHSFLTLAIGITSAPSSRKEKNNRCNSIKELLNLTNYAPETSCSSVREVVETFSGRRVRALRRHRCANSSVGSGKAASDSGCISLLGGLIAWLENSDTDLCHKW